MSKLEDFDIGLTLDQRIARHIEECKKLPRDAQSNYWRFHVFRKDPEICEFMTGMDYEKLTRYRNKVNKEGNSNGL